MESFSDRDLAPPPAPVERVVEIDTLRALAMTGVVAQHSQLFPPGWTGVWLFYVISGFVVTGAIRSRSGEGSAATSLFNFYVRRAARIWPVYFLVLGLAVITSAFIEHTVPWPAVVSLVFFYNNFALANGFGEIHAYNIGNLWTVSVEMQFYLLYGALLILAPRKLVVAVLVATIVACPIGRYLYGNYLAAIHEPPLDSAFFIYSSSLLQFDGFAAGSLIAIYQSRITARVARAVFAVGVLAFAAYCGAYVWIGAQAGLHGAGLFRNIISGILFGAHREAFAYTSLIALWSGVICLIAAGAVRLPVLRLPLLTRIGAVSYGAYVFHTEVLALLNPLIGGAFEPHGVEVYLVRLLIFASAMLATVTLAEISYRFFEQPIVRRTGAWLRNRARGTSTPSGAAAESSLLG